MSFSLSTTVKYISLAAALFIGVVMADTALAQEAYPLDTDYLVSDTASTSGHAANPQASLQTDIKSLLYLITALLIGTCAMVAAAFMSANANFSKVHLLLNQALQALSKESQIRQRELDLAAVMIHAELKTNQSKVDAYLVIYQDLLDSLNDPDADHRYKRAGEIVRSAPALDRTIYDTHIHRLDGLGAELIPQVVEFYAQVDYDPAYSNLEPDMDHSTATRMVESVVQHANALKQDIDAINELFSKKGFNAVNLMFSN